MALTPVRAPMSPADTDPAVHELLDVVLHGTAALNIQAGAADALLTRDPERARDAVVLVGALARQALDDLRRLSAMLGASGRSTYAPQPGFAHAAALPVAPSAQLAAFRIAEAAVDAARQPGSTVLTLRVSAATITVELTSGSIRMRAVEELLVRAARYNGVVARLASGPSHLDVRVDVPLGATNGGTATTNG